MRGKNNVNAGRNFVVKKKEKLCCHGYRENVGISYLQVIIDSFVF